MYKKKFQKPLLLFVFSFFLFKADAVSLVSKDAFEGCPNPRHMLLSCGAEYDFCNGAGVAGFFAAMIDWMAMEIEYCPDSPVKRQFFQRL